MSSSTGTGTRTRIWRWILVTAILCFARGAFGTFTCGKGVTATVYSQCKLLPSLGASLAWTLNTDTNTIDFAFTEDLETTGGWVAWGINPAGAQMVGTQALAAFRNSSGLVTVRTYDVTGAVKAQQRSLVPAVVSVAYSNYSAVATAGGTVTIAGRVALKAGQSTALNLVWNRGPTVVALTSELGIHALSASNLVCTAVVDMASGAQSGGGQIPNKRLKDIHGILSAVSWGIVLPIGVMIARYLRPFGFADPAWFYLHVIFQITGYAGGTAGWVIGLKLLKVAQPVKYKHRNLGIAIWALATFQILGAILLRPKKKHKRRIYWDVVHHVVGFAVIVVAIVNIFEGLHLLDEDKWRRVYIIILAALGIVAVVLELITWFHWLHKRRRNRHKHSQLVGDT